jgi:signal transduction histidine kinase
VKAGALPWTRRAPRPRTRIRRFPGLLKSAALRFALLYALVFGISAVALATFVWWQTAGLLDRQTIAAINADVQGLAEQWSQGGTPALLLTIRSRLAAHPRGQAIYLLADPSFHPIFGNLSHWPTGVTMTQEWFELPVEREGTRSLARIHRFDLPDGFHLLVGRDAALGAQLRRLLTGALLWAILVVLVLGGAGAIVIRGLFRRSLAGIFATVSAISAGDLARRVPRTNNGDEFDSLAETINDMLDRINRLMDGVRHVSDAIAHDLRTPITRARVRLEDAARHAKGAEDLRAAIDRAQGDLDAVVGIFQALLRIAEIESGASRSAFTRFDLVPLIRDLGEFYEAVAEDRACTLSVSLADEAFLFGDPTLIQQAVANLVDNALKFSPPGATVTLALSASPALCITVADHGPGMSDAERERAAERFYRAEAARSTPGSGLGLSLVNAVAMLHGGVLMLFNNDPGVRAEMHLGEAAAAHPHSQPG